MASIKALIASSTHYAFDSDNSIFLSGGPLLKGKHIFLENTGEAIIHSNNEFNGYVPLKNMKSEFVKTLDTWAAKAVLIKAPRSGMLAN